MSSSEACQKGTSEKGFIMGMRAASGIRETRDLKGTTSARARRMSMEERNLVLLKRKLRNRASAVRSRKRRLEVIEKLYAQLIELSLFASQLEERLKVLELERLRGSSLADTSLDIASRRQIESVSFEKPICLKEPLVLLLDTSSLLEKSFAEWSASLNDLELDNYFSLDVDYPNNSI